MMKPLQLGFGSVFAYIGYYILMVETGINESIQHAGSSGTYNSTSIEYTTLLLTNINGMLLAFIILSVGVILITDSLPYFLAWLYHVVKNGITKDKDTL